MTTETILGTTVYGTPSGNYDGSSQDWFSDAVQAAADAYRQERDTKGPASAMRVWEDHKAYIDMTFMPKSQSSLKARF